MRCKQAFRNNNRLKLKRNLPFPHGANVITGQQAQRADVFSANSNKLKQQKNTQDAQCNNCSGQTTN